MAKAKRRPLIVKLLAALLALILVVLLLGKLWFWYPAAGYYAASKAAFDIPGLGEGYVPQGLDYVEDTDQLLFTGYSNKGGPSPLYVVDASTGKLVKRMTMVFADGTTATTHNGGIEEHHGLIYVCDSHADVLRVFTMEELTAAENGGAIHEIGSVPLHTEGDAVSPAFVEAGPDGLVVGEFYRPVNYETLPSHHIGAQHALAVVLPYDEASPVGVSASPISAYSLPDLVQGMCFDDEGCIFLSESWGASPSTIEVFKPGKATAEVTVLGVQVPLTVLDEHNRISAVKLAPMAEEIAIVDGKLYVNCESASAKYLFGLLNGAQKIYATDLSYFKKH